MAVNEVCDKKSLMWYADMLDRIYSKAISRGEEKHLEVAQWVESSCWAWLTIGSDPRSPYKSKDWVDSTTVSMPEDQFIHVILFPPLAPPTSHKSIKVIRTISEQSWIQWPASFIVRLLWRDGSWRPESPEGGRLASLVYMTKLPEQ